MGFVYRMSLRQRYSKDLKEGHILSSPPSRPQASIAAAKNGAPFPVGGGKAADCSDALQ